MFYKICYYLLLCFFYLYLYLFVPIVLICSHKAPSSIGQAGRQEVISRSDRKLSFRFVSPRRWFPAAVMSHFSLRIHQWEDHLDSEPGWEKNKQKKKQSNNAAHKAVWCVCVVMCSMTARKKEKENQLQNGGRIPTWIISVFPGVFVFQRAWQFSGGREEIFSFKLLVWSSCLEYCYIYLPVT